MEHKKKQQVETSIAQGMHFIDRMTGAVIPPLQPSTTFARDEDYQLLAPQHSYGRDDNPSFGPAERMLARLEDGEDALLFSSGMAAAMAVIQALKPGDHVVAPAVMYWGLRNWLGHFCDNWGLELDLFAPFDMDDLARKVKKGRTRIVWIETPCNPTWDVIDIAQAVNIARDAGARVVVDSHVATAVLTRPLALGADLVVHSAAT